MKRKQFYPNFLVLSYYGIIVLFFAILTAGLFVFRLSWLYNFDGISKEVEKKIKSVDKQSFSYDNVIPYYLGVSIYKDMDWLAKNMTQKEAEKVLNYPNPVVRITAYRSLLNYNSQSFSEKNFQILSQALQEHEILTGSSGSCVQWVAPASYFFSDMYFYLGEKGYDRQKQINFLKADYHLTNSEMKHLLHLHQISENKIDSVYEAFRSR